MRLLIPRLTMVLLCQAVVFANHRASDAAQGPLGDLVPTEETLSPESSLDSVGSAPASGSVPGPAVAEIVLAQSRFENVREGYQALQWNEIEGASRYQVLDTDGYSYYDGTLTEAFISGLPDGEHTFEVQAFSADNVLVGITSQPAVIEVRHWPMSQAWASFAVGLVVFLAMIGLIVVGAARSSSPTHGGSKPEAES